MASSLPEDLQLSTKVKRPFLSFIIVSLYHKCNGTKLSSKILKLCSYPFNCTRKMNKTSYWSFNKIHTLLGFVNYSQIILLRKFEFCEGLDDHQHCVKSVRIRSYSDPHFPAFRLNTEICSMYLRIQTRITLNTGTFYVVQN